VGHARLKLYIYGFCLFVNNHLRNFSIYRAAANIKITDNFDICLIYISFGNACSFTCQPVRILVRIASPYSHVYRKEATEWGPVRIRVRIGSPYVPVSDKRGLNGKVLWMRPEKPRNHVTAGVAQKISLPAQRPWAEHGPKFCSRSQVMVAFPYKWRSFLRGMQICKYKQCFTCHTCCNTGTRNIRSHPKDWHPHPTV
jgi:hypothetical protein